MLERRFLVCALLACCLSSKEKMSMLRNIWQVKMLFLVFTTIRLIHRENLVNIEVTSWRAVSQHRSSEITKGATLTKRECLVCSYMVTTWYRNCCKFQIGNDGRNVVNAESIRNDSLYYDSPDMQHEILVLQTAATLYMMTIQLIFCVL